MATVIAGREGDLPSSTARSIIKRGWAAARAAWDGMFRRKQVVEALRESEERFRDLYENAPVAYLAVGLDGRIRRANQNAVGLLGYDLDTLVGRPVFDLYADTPAGKDKAKKVVEQFRAGQETRDEEMEMRRADGRSIWISLSVRPIRDQQGQVLETQSMVVDITERKRAEEELRESEAKYYDLYDNAPDMFVSVYPKTAKIVGCNWTLARALDYTKEEIIGRPIFDMYHPDCMEDVRKAFRSFVETGEVHDAELQLKRKDGSKIDVSLNISAVRDEEGNIRYSRSAWREITKLKQAEEALRQSEERFRITLDGMMEACAIIGFDWRYLYVNDAHARQGRRTKEEHLGRTVMEMYPRIEETEAFPHLRRCMEERIPQRLENEYSFPDGSKAWFNLSIQPVPEGIFGLSIDITERKRTEEALQKAREELEGKVERQLLRRNPYGLTFRELTVLHMVAAGESDKQIGITLGISHLTAQKHLSNILAKMDVASRTEASVRAVREGLLE